MPGPGVGPNGPSRTLAEGGQRVRSTRGRRGASDQNGWVPVEPRDTGRTGRAEKVGMGGRGPGAYLGVAKAGVSPSPGPRWRTGPRRPARAHASATLPPAALPEATVGRNRTQVTGDTPGLREVLVSRVSSGCSAEVEPPSCRPRTRRGSIPA